MTLILSMLLTNRATVNVTGSLVILFAMARVTVTAGKTDANDLSCPGSIVVKPTVQEANKDWHILDRASAAQLDQIAFYLHDPSKKGALVH
jgi:hypothetical protein